ncbi:protein FAM50 [Echinococcus multilocularis]|uniref:Protein FAM50 n=1 Tax=Echinococcus multilocularis TaxID=6211 RepID=A0A068YD03_ECHMU|nr:protein FAM50 [Echinococcus multilocularis]
MQLLKQREKERQEIEFQKKKLEAELRVGEFTNKFTVQHDSIENQLKTDTIGLVTLDEMKARQQAVITQREKELALGKANKAKFGETRHGKHGVVRRGPISFNEDEEDELTESEDERPPLSLKHPNDKHCISPSVSVTASSNDIGGVVDPNYHETNEAGTEEFKKKRRRLGKNPDVDTSFLPDIDRDEEEKQLREELRREWHAKQAAIKEEEINITYSYWDGSGHRRQVKMKKGHSIHLFLHRCLDQLRKDFSELRAASADQMMYIKEDLIIPHHYTFYDFIVTKARGKSGPLFSFDVYDDVRLRMDVSKEKEESHAGKVCLRSWYERHKHIFPASRWEPYDPAKNWDQYTISDKMSVKITIK